MEEIFVAITKSESIAILVLMVVCVAQAKFILMMRQEARMDRKEERESALLVQKETNVIMERLRESIDQMRSTIAAKG